MEVDVREFLNRFSPDELKNRGVLRGDTQILRSGSVSPLINLMADQKITRLVAPERNWFLTSDGEFQNPLSSEAKSGRVEDLRNPGDIFNFQNTSINPYFRGGKGPELDTVEEDSSELKFGLERDLQKALRANIQQLEPGLKLIDGGAEKSVEAGRIDITAEDAEGCLVVIELKAGEANLRSIGQLLAYMGSVSDDPNQCVRGILIANDFDHRTVAAARAVPNLSLVAYSFQFSFSQRK